MGFIADEYVPMRQPDYARKEEQDDSVSPSIIDMLQAGGVTGNFTYRGWRYMQNQADEEFDPAHDPFEMIRDTDYASDPMRFAHSRNENETRAIMAAWDEDREARDVLSRSGAAGTVAQIGMGLLDPTLLIPGAQIFSGVAKGANVARVAADVAISAGATAAAGEAIMFGTTPEMTAAEGVVNIGAATVLGGLIGGGATAMLGSVERKALLQSFEKDRAEWVADVAPTERSINPQSVGAAASDTRQLEMRNIPFTNKLPDPTAKISPPRRVLNSGFVSARRALVDLVETPYIFKENEAGLATTQGPSLDRLARMETNKARYAVSSAFDSAYARYRFGKTPDNMIEGMSQKINRLKSHVRPNGDKVDFAEFRSLVDDALRNGDTHDIPEVAEMAGIIRNEVLAPWRDRAISAGLLPEGIETATADSYMTRVWNKEKLIGERPKARETFGDWLEAQEATKIKLQEQLDPVYAKMQANADLIAKAEKEGGLTPVARAKLDADNLALRAQMEDVVRQWEGKSAKGAKKALEKRDAKMDGRDPDKTRLVEADQNIDDAVRRILSNSRIDSRDEIDALADEIIDRITGSPDGRLPLDVTFKGIEIPRSSDGKPDPRGPLAARDFMIPDALVRDFIDTDVMNTTEIYLNTMVPDVLLTERFGDTEMSDVFKRLHDEAAAQQHAAKTPAQRRKIKSKADNAEADLAAMRDRIRHSYGFSTDPRIRLAGRIAASASRFDMMTNLGGAALSSLPDLAGLQWRHGMNGAFRHAWKPFIKAMTSKETRRALRQYKQQLRTLGIAADTYLNTRSSAISDVTDIYRPGTGIERGLKAGSDKFGVVSLLSQWTDFGKFAAGMVSGGEIIRASEALVKGSATKRQIRDLAEGGIDAAMAARINKSIKADGGADIVDGITIPNSGNWTDRGARDAFEGAMGRDVDMMILTPGQEKPLFMSKPLGAVLLQYKSFIAAANERLLVRSLQQRDRAVLSGIVSAIGLGVMSEAVYSWLLDRDMPNTAPDMIKAGLSRSGALGWYQEGNAVLSKWTGGTADMFRVIGTSRPDSRYISRSKWGAVLGPTANKVENIIATGSNVANMKWSAGDTRRMRRLLIGQNLFYIRTKLDLLEREFNDAVGVENYDE